MLAPSPFVTTPVWPIPGDVPDLLAIVGDQAETIAAQAVLIDAYQGNLNAVQNPPPAAPATGNGAVVTNTTSLPVTGVVGTIVTGAAVGNTGNAVAPTVLGLITGTAGSNGTYLLSAPVTLASVTALTFTAPAGTSTWPIPRDADTLNAIVQAQTAILRTQGALLQHYQDVLNTSEVPVPPTGP